MRVISGVARGHNLQAPDGLHTRPTVDRVKESLFNILSPYLYECSFLDLFAGTGSIGIEALSRGASNAVFIDNDIASCKIIEKNLKHTKLADKANIVNADCINALSSDKIKKNKFDIIFLDPPYEKNYVPKCLQLLVENKLLHKNSLIVCEQENKNDLPTCDKLYLSRIKEYKTSRILFFELEDTI